MHIPFLLYNFSNLFYFQISTYWCPISITNVDGTENSWPLPKAKYDFNGTNRSGLRYEAEGVRRCIREGKIESENISHKESLLIAHIQDEIRKQIGVTYPEDD